MSYFAIAGGGGSKGALYRETLQATGFDVGRVLIATAKFAPMPRSVLGYPRGSIPTVIGMRFQRHDGIYQSDKEFFMNATPNWTSPPANVQTRVRERAGRITPSLIVLMSSGRLFLDRVGCHQSPSPLHRRDQNNLFAQANESNYHRTVTSVLTGCLKPGGKSKGLP
jgi:hypothetical protein